MKKIGILTFHRANNYGALLQAYALKRSLKQLGAIADIINYSSNKMESNYKFFYGKKTIKWFLKKIFNLFFIYKIIKNNNNLNKFRKKYLIDTVLLNSESINDIENKYDAFISGSDQVFNSQIINFDNNYLLDFVNDNNKKYSYAASLGFTKFTFEEEYFLKNNLNSFCRISVREKQAADIINKITNKQVLTHLDPTLLLNKNNWEKIADKIDINEDYILVYLIFDDDKIVSFAKKLAREKNLKLINISSRIFNKTKIKTIFPNPEKWISYFIKAKYIVTNSFHGLTFSINFNKQFFIDFLLDSWAVNSRVEDLLDLTNLRDRLIDNIGTNYDKTINWNSVNKIIKQEREKSLDYLKSIVL